MEMISEAKLRNIAGEKGYNLIFLEKDYFITALLFQLKDVEGLYFKGGTALNKIFLRHRRLSEDIDFTSTLPVTEAKKIIEQAVGLDKVHFRKIEQENERAGFVRIYVYYNSYFGKDARLAIDVNSRATLHLPPERKPVKNFYGIAFTVPTLNIEELLAEKVRAAITRNQPRDYFDLYFILKKYEVNLSLAKKKTEEAGETYDIERIFRNSRTVFSRWDEDVGKLTTQKLNFVTCMKFLEKRLRV